MGIKVKDILSEIKWGNNNIELGQVVTFKDYPAFKTPTQIKEEDNHEVGMALSSLKTSLRSSKIIYDQIKKRDLKELEGWVQEKLTKSSDYLQTVADYLQDYDEYDKE